MLGVKIWDVDSTVEDGTISMAIRLNLLMPPKSVITIQVWLFEPNIYCLELPREFSEVYNMAVHIAHPWSWGLWSSLSSKFAYDALVWTLWWWSAHPWKCCLPLCMKHACLFCNSFRCNKSYKMLQAPILVGPCPHWNWESNCFWFRLRLNFMLPTLDPPFLPLWRDLVEPSFTQTSSFLPNSISKQTSKDIASLTWPECII